MQEIWDLYILKNTLLLDWLNLQELSPTKNKVGTILKKEQNKDAKHAVIRMRRLTMGHIKQWDVIYM